MSHVVWLDGGLVDPDTAALPITDPGVRWGDGLFETMRAEQRRVPNMGRHLARLSASIRALALDPIPTDAQIRRAVDAVVAQLDDGPHRLRITVTTRPTLLVEATSYQPLTADHGASAVTLRGAWWPGDELHEHKTLSYAGHRLAHRRAAAQGADCALLLDDHGRLGEADAANVLIVTGGAIATAPIQGILGGVTREVLLEQAQALGIPVQVRHIEEAEWRAADEILLTNGLAGVTSVTSIDGQPVGIGTAGPMAARLREAYTAAANDG